MKPPLTQGPAHALPHIPHAPGTWGWAEELIPTHGILVVYLFNHFGEWTSLNHPHIARNFILSFVDVFFCFDPFVLDLQQVSWRPVLGGQKGAAKDTCWNSVRHVKLHKITTHKLGYTATGKQVALRPIPMTANDQPFYGHPHLITQDVDIKCPRFIEIAKSEVTVIGFSLVVSHHLEVSYKS